MSLYIDMGGGTQVVIISRSAEPAMPELRRHGGSSLSRQIPMENYHDKKTVEGPLVTEPAYESKKAEDDFLTKKHAMECAKLLKEFKEVKERDLESKNGTKMEAVGKDQNWKNKIEEILTLMEEMTENHKEKEDHKIKEVDDGKMIQGIDRLKEQESEAAEEEEENSRKPGTESSGLQTKQKKT